MFFADKAIFIEGDTERILLPAMMKKIDVEEFKIENELDLLSQNISIVDVGAHSHIFEKFIDFIGVKSLIITDLDCHYLEPVFKDGIQQFYKNKNPRMSEVKCPADDPKAKRSSNSSLLHYFEKKEDDLEFFKKLSFESKILLRNIHKKWESNLSGNLLIIYQTEEKSYHARSFEDAFFHINYDFICEDENKFEGITDSWLEDFKIEKNAFQLAENGVKKKPTLAIDILLNDDTYTKWSTPEYIKKGLLWLRKG